MTGRIKEYQIFPRHNRNPHIGHQHPGKLLSHDPLMVPVEMHVRFLDLDTTNFVNDALARTPFVNDGFEKANSS